MKKKLFKMFFFFCFVYTMFFFLYFGLLHVKLIWLTGALSYGLYRIREIAVNGPNLIFVFRIVRTMICHYVINHYNSQNEFSWEQNCINYCLIFKYKINSSIKLQLLAKRLIYKTLSKPTWKFCIKFALQSVGKWLHIITVYINLYIFIRVSKKGEMMIL